MALCQLLDILSGTVPKKFNLRVKIVINCEIYDKNNGTVPITRLSEWHSATDKCPTKIKSVGFAQKRINQSVKKN